MKVTIKDDNNIPKLMKSLKQFNDATISVGVPDGKKNREGVTLTDIAAVHEFGATITAKKKKYLAIPLQRKYKGRSPREFNDLFFVPSKSGDGGTLCKSKGKGKKAKVEACYWLTKSVKIPERSFLRACVDEKQEEFYKFAEKKLDEWLQTNSDPTPMLNALGEQFVGYVKKYINDLSSPPNALITKNVKGSANPLIDTGNLRDSIEWEIK